MVSVTSVRKVPESRQSAAAIADQICRLLTAEVTRDWRGEIRGPKRYAFPQLIQVQPLGRDGTPEGEALVACGRDISAEGIGFYMPQPLSCARAILSFQGRDGEKLSVLTKQRWCRFTQYGWYENGGVFLRVVPAVPDGKQAGPVSEIA